MCQAARLFETEVLEYLDDIAEACPDHLRHGRTETVHDWQALRQLLRARVLRIFEAFLTSLRSRQSGISLRASESVSNIRSTTKRARSPASRQRKDDGTLDLLPDLDWNGLFRSFIDAVIHQFSAKEHPEPVVLRDAPPSSDIAPHSTNASSFLATVGRKHHEPFPRTLLQQMNMFENPGADRAPTTHFEDCDGEWTAWTPVQLTASKKMRKQQDTVSPSAMTVALGSPLEVQTRTSTDNKALHTHPSPAKLMKSQHKESDGPSALDRDLAFLAQALESELEQRKNSSLSPDVKLPATIPVVTHDCTKLPSSPTYHDDFTFGLELSNCLHSLDRLEAKLFKRGSAE